MKIYIKRLICGIAALSMTAVPVMAADLDDYEIDEINKTVTLRGTIDGAKKYDDITLQLLKKDKTIKNGGEYSGSEIVNDFVLFTQVTADENGGYAVTVDMTDEPVGFYMMRVNGRETEKKVFYSTTEEKEKVVAQIAEIIKKPKTEAVAELAALLDLKNEYSTAVGMLNLSERTIFLTDPSGLCEAIYETLKADGVKSDTIVEKINTASYAEAVREGIVDIADYAEKLNFDKKYTDAYARLKDTVKASFTEKYFKGKANLTAVQLTAAYNRAVTDALVANFGGWGDVDYFMTNFGETVGINMTAFDKLTGSKKSEFYEKMSSAKAFADTDAFKNAANTEIARLGSESGGGTSTKPSGGGYGGGGYGGGIGGSKTDETKPIQTPAETEKAEFADLDGFDWAKESIEALAAKSIVNGVGDNLFDPSSNVTREQFLAMLMRAYNISPDINEGLSFADTAVGEWYAGYVAVGVKLGIVNGVSDTEFGIGAQITRQDAAVMAYRAALANGKTFDKENGASFADDAQIADYANEAVYAMRGSGVINGKDNRFCPLETCTRAEAAKIIYMLIK